MALQGTANDSLDDKGFDSGLSYLTSNVNKVVLCSQSPTTFTEANVTYKLGEKTSYTVGSPANKAGGGREVTASAVSGGSVTSSGTATHVAYLNTTGSELLAVRQLASSVAVTSGNTWSYSAQTIGIPAPV